MAAGWTGRELDLVREMHARALPPQDIAARLGKSVEDVVDRMALMHLVEVPGGRPPIRTYGADEEGDVVPVMGGADDDPAAWVHVAPGDKI